MAWWDDVAVAESRCESGDDPYYAETAHAPDPWDVVRRELDRPERVEAGATDEASS